MRPVLGKAKGMLNGAHRYGKQFLGLVSGQGAKLLQGVKGFAQKTANFAKAAGQRARGLVTALQSRIGGFVNGAMQRARNVANQGRGLLGKVMGPFMGMATKAFDAVQSRVSQAVNMVKTVALRGKDIALKVGRKVVDVTRKATTLLKEFTQSAIQKGRQAVQKARQWSSQQIKKATELGRRQVAQARKRVADLVSKGIRLAKEKALTGIKQKIGGIKQRVLGFLKDRWNRLKDKLGIKKTDAKTDKPTGKLEQPKVKPEEPTVDTTKGTDPSTDVATRHGGGRAGIGESGWRKKEEYSSLSQKELQEKVEQLRHQLLQRKDIGRVKNALLDLGIPADEQLIAAVKRYNFDSTGIGFMADNYDCWTRLARGEGSIRDAQYLVHEMREVRELQRIQQQTGFDFMGTNYEQMTRKQQKQWDADFDRYYMQSHRKALESEYDFLAEQVSAATNGRVEIPRNVVASVDPTRGEARSYMLVDGAPLQDHPNFNSWQQRGQETVEIGKGARERLGIRYENPTLAELVRAVKQRKLK